MILKSLRLRNIRSYEQLQVEFPQGTILFEGDIGSGKSTLLMAVEFALFGLGSLKGASLLRTGAKEGYVTLAFDVNGQEFTANRTLVKQGKTVHQGTGYFADAKGRVSLEPSELKERVLNILSFNEPEDPNAQSWIYRYAVFTPQEEMKTILTYKPEIRLQILRKAFRLEEYKTARENADKLDADIRRKIAELNAETGQLEPKRKSRTEKNVEMARNKEKLSQLEVKEAEHDAQLKRVQDAMHGLHEDKVRLRELQAEIPQIRKQSQATHTEIESLSEDRDATRKKIEALMEEIGPLVKVKRPSTLTAYKLEEKIEALEEKEKNLTANKAKIEAKLEDYARIEREKKCPTCDRPVHATDFRELVMSKRQEERAAAEGLDECATRIREERKTLKRLQEFERKQEKLVESRQRAEELKLVLERSEGKIRNLNSEGLRLGKELAQKTAEAEKLTDVQGKIVQLERSIALTNDALKRTRNDIASLEQRNADLKGEIEELSGEIEKMEGAKKAAEKLEDFHIWLSDYFIKTLALIERQVLVSINQDFNAQFRRWFSLLVEDPTKDARIDEDFTPAVEQDGYEQDYEFLSGGEKTSVALAYRLALNKVVQQVAVGMKSNLLILDEPTDGFSREQLYKIREILHEVECPQIIIVSHENELESFANHIFQVSKDAGKSKVEIAA